MLSIKVPLLTSKLASNGNRTFSFDVANNTRNRISWRNADTLNRCDPASYAPPIFQLLSCLPTHVVFISTSFVTGHISASGAFWHEPHIVFAVPTCVGRIFIVWHRSFLLISWSKFEGYSDRCLGQTYASLPGIAGGLP